MKKKIITISISVILVAAIIVGVVTSKLRQLIPDNPATAVGNTSGNLNNGGYFCEHDGYIYFANLNDNHYLYKMDLNCTKAELVKDVPVSYINCGGDYIYFYYDDTAGAEAKFMGFSGKMSGIYRIKNTGDDMHSLLRCTSGVVNLIGNSLYFEHYDNTDGMTLYYVTTDGKEKEQACKAIINPACVVNGSIYYSNNEQGMQLYSYRPGSANPTRVLEYAMYNPVLDGNYLYFQNMNDNYCLYRYGVSNGALEKITSERVDVFNVLDGVIFYQRLNNPALIKINADGSGEAIVAEGTFSNINCTSTYTFFTPFDEDTMYITPTHGSGQSGTFNP